MDHYGISAIHWNENLGEIDEVLLHKFVRHEDDGTLVLRRGEPMWCSDVVSLIRGGDTVWIMQSLGPDRYMNTDHVGINVKRGQQSYLYSCTRNGTPTGALMDLPRYQKPDDPPPEEPDAGSLGDRAGPT